MNTKEIIEEPAQELHETATEGESPKSPNSFIKNVALFFASPFIALAYAAALPFVGFYKFTQLGHQARVKKQLPKRWK